MGVGGPFCNVESDMTNPTIIELIDKYLAGQCAPEERRIVEQWYDTYRQSEADFYQGNPGAVDASEARSLSAIRSKLGLSPARKLRKLYPLLAAASVLFAIVVGVISHRNRQKPETFAIVDAGAGHIKHIQLPDGTEAWLNAGSSLKYSSSYNQHDRQISLTGEAYFDVADNKDKPFTVSSGSLHTLVLGTAFSISAYPGALMHTVTVIRGKVEVSENSRRVLGDLLPNQEIAYTVGSGTVSLINTNAEKLASWKNGKLSYIQMPMQDIAIHLQQWYGQQFIFRNQALKDRKFTASFDNNISLDELLSVMQEVTHTPYHIDRQTKTVTFY